MYCFEYIWYHLYFWCHLSKRYKFFLMLQYVHICKHKYTILNISGITCTSGVTQIKDIICLFLMLQYVDISK